MFTDRWRKLASRHKPGTLRTRHGIGGRRARPRVESLEDRCLLAATVIGQYAIPTAHAAAFGITAGPDGNFWFTEFKGNQIGEIDPATGALAEYSLNTPFAVPFGIASGPDGRVWFTEMFANQIGAIDPATHSISEYALPTSDSLPLGITAGPDGNVWFTESQGNQIGTIDPTTNAISEYPIPTGNCVPTGITAGPDGDLWFAENNSSRIGVINPTTHVITEFNTPTVGSEPLAILAGPDGNLWFTENHANKIGVINPTTHAMSEYTVAGAGSQNFWIAAGADGNLWFTEMKGNRIGEINPSTHVIHQYGIPTADSAPGGIAAAPDGTLWFTEARGNRIGQVFLAPHVIANPVPQTIDAGQTATFVASATGVTVPAVQWQVSTNGGRTFTPLQDGSVYSGVTTSTLTVTGAPAALSGTEYRAVFSNSARPGANAVTTPATLTVHRLPTMGALTVTQWTADAAGFVGTLAIRGGTGPFLITNASGLPTGLTMSVSGRTLVLMGTPTVAQLFASGSVTVQDATGVPVTQTFQVTIAAPLQIPSTGLLSASVGMKYQATLQATGGTGTITYRVTVGKLPAGLKLRRHGTITGVPKRAGFFTFTITATDTVGATFSQVFTLTVL